MSITTLKKKTSATRNISGVGSVGFSLNNPRRVDSHSGEIQMQTAMRGTGYKGHGGKHGKFIINPIRSQYVNFDTFNTPRPSVKNTAGQLSTSLKWLNRPYPHSTVANKDNLSYIALKAAKNTCTTASNTVGKGSCNNWYDHSYKMDYQTYNTTNVLRNNRIPPPQSLEHYPPPVSSSTNCRQNLSFIDFVNRTGGTSDCNK